MMTISPLPASLMAAVLCLFWSSPASRSQDAGLDTLLEASDSSNEDTRGDRAKRPPPSASESRKSLASVKEIFREEFASATTPDKRLALARHLVSQAQKTPDPTDRWTLLNEAMRLASDAGDVETTFDAIRQTSAEFATDADALRVDALVKLGGRASNESANTLARTALALARKCADAENDQLSQKCISLASNFARKAKNPSLVAEVTKAQQSIREVEKIVKERRTIAAKLTENPNDPDVCLEAGKFFCFKEGDWDRGLQLLSRGSDTELSRLATVDINSADDPNSVVSLADAWWTWADTERLAMKSGGYRRAAMLYESIIASNSGLERARLEKRLRQAEADGKGLSKTVFLADLKESKVRGINAAFTKDGTFSGKPFTCGGKEWPKGLVAMPAETASVIYDLPQGAKRVTGKAGVFTPSGNGGQPLGTLTFEILVDGKSAWTSPPLRKRDETATFDVELYGARQIELVTKCTNGFSAWMAWLDPVVAY